MSVTLSVQLAPNNQKGLVLSNPVIAASGTFGYGTEYAEIIDIQQLGAVACKGITLKPRTGNPQPRMTETAAGVLNSIGMENIGVDALINEKAPLWAEWQVPVIVNILGESVEEYITLAEKLDAIPGISGLEVNISCPNVSQGGMEFGANPKLAQEITRSVKKSTTLPVIVKLSPNVTDITEIAGAVVEGGADAITLINTLKGCAIDVQNRKPVLSNVVGGLSGPAIKPVAVTMVYQVYNCVTIPIIGCGGITTTYDALEFIMAGASAVQIGTGTFSNPSASIEIIRGIEHFMEKEGIHRLTDIIGAAH